MHSVINQHNQSSQARDALNFIASMDETAEEAEIDPEEFFTAVASGNYAASNMFTRLAQRVRFVGIRK